MFVWMDVWMHGMAGLMDSGMDAWMHSRRDGGGMEWMHGCIGAWVHGWKVGWMAGR